MGVDLREQITLCDVGDIFTIPANNEKSFDQISKGIAHVFSSGAFPIILGGDHSIGFPTWWGLSPPRRQESRHHPLRPPRRHPGDRPGRTDAHLSVVPRNQHGQCTGREPGAAWHRWLASPSRRREGARERGTNVLTVTDITEMGLEAAAQYAIERATDGTDCVYISFDIDCIDAGFVPGTGWPEPGGLLAPGSSEAARADRAQRSRLRPGDRRGLPPTTSAT